MKSLFVVSLPAFALYNALRGGAAIAEPSSTYLDFGWRNPESGASQDQKTNTAAGECAVHDERVRTRRFRANRGISDGECARSERPEQRRSRRSCRPIERPAVPNRPRTHARHGQRGSALTRHRRNPCPRLRTRVAPMHAVQRVAVLLLTAAVCEHTALVDHHAVSHLNDSERVPITMRVDTNNEVQFICEHPSTSSPALGRTSGAGLGTETASRNTVTGHAQKADRLLIRPASGHQAGTGLFARTHLAKDIRERSHVLTESRPKSTSTTLANAPDGTPTHSQCSKNTPDARQ